MIFYTMKKDGIAFAVQLICYSFGFKSTTSIDRALGAARKLAGHFHHSTLATAELYKKQVQMDKDKQS